MSVRVDKIDWEIIRILEKNGRAPNKEIAEQIGVSEGTVRNRIKKLTDHQFLRIRGLTNPNDRTEEALVYMGIKIAVNRNSMKISEAVSKLSCVKSVAVVTGRYDLFVEVYVEPYNIIKVSKHGARQDRLHRFGRKLHRPALREQVRLNRARLPDAPRIAPSTPRNL